MIFKKLSQGLGVFDVVSVASPAGERTMAFSRLFGQEFALKVNVNQSTGLFSSTGTKPLLHPANCLFPVK